MLTPQQAIQQPSRSSSGSHAAVQVSAAAPANERRAPTSKTSDQQKRINRELVVVGKRSSLEVLNVVQRNLGQMNGVNLATAFHRISRGGVDLQRVSGSGIFNRLLEVSECYAEQVMAWSCAQLRVFRPSFFAKLAGVATPQLRSCQPYEVTNMLWAFAEFYKYDQDSASGVAPELRVLLDAVADVFSTRSPGDFKVQVLTSALMSVLPSLEVRTHERDKQHEPDTGEIRPKRPDAPGRFGRISPVSGSCCLSRSCVLTSSDGSVCVCV